MSFSNQQGVMSHVATTQGTAAKGMADGCFLRGIGIGSDLI